MQETQNLKLQIYEATDITSYLNVNNSNTSKIDEFAGNVNSTLKTDQTTINQINTDIENINSNISAISSNVSELSNRNTTNETEITNLKANVLLNTTHNNDQDNEITTIKTTIETHDQNIQQLQINVEEADSNIEKLLDTINNKYFTLTSSQQPNNPVNFECIVIKQIAGGKNRYLIYGTLPFIYLEGTTTLTCRTSLLNIEGTKSSYCPFYHNTKISFLRLIGGADNTFTLEFTGADSTGYVENVTFLVAI